MKLVKENINSFIRNQDPVKSLGLGYEAKIHNFFRQYGIDDLDYIVKENGEIIFYYGLDLNRKNISELPDNLTIPGYLDIIYTNITKLPNKLSVGKIYLVSTNITELPNDIIIKGTIYVNSSQIYLINFIKQSKFKNQLTIWGS